ncbi:hypothetical protein GPICK_16000 [Geobacter pickeringii]|uniref:Uncharacterized protein n=1 Tax=Geobacter pickeringii TaxID=345632 RepID=A0A0B5BKS7_9BACT|nr:hypothetical protein GPICK_16000 [Geobacter pickeringii]
MFVQLLEASPERFPGYPVQTICFGIMEFADWLSALRFCCAPFGYQYRERLGCWQGLQGAVCFALKESAGDLSKPFPQLVS